MYYIEHYTSSSNAMLTPSFPIRVYCNGNNSLIFFSSTLLLPAKNVFISCYIYSLIHNQSYAFTTDLLMVVYLLDQVVVML